MLINVAVNVVITWLVVLKDGRLSLLQFLSFCIYFWFSENNKAEVGIKEWIARENKLQRKAEGSSYK